MPGKIFVNKDSALQVKRDFFQVKNDAFVHDVLYSKRTCNIVAQNQCTYTLNIVDTTYNKALDLLLRDASKIELLAKKFEKIDENISKSISDKIDIGW